MAEIARELGGKQFTVQAAPKSAAKRHRRTSSSVGEQVLALRGRGVIPVSIADTLNVSDERVKKILTAA